MLQNRWECGKNVTGDKTSSRPIRWELHDWLTCEPGSGSDGLTDMNRVQTVSRCVLATKELFDVRGGSRSEIIGLVGRSFSSTSEKTKLCAKRKQHVDLKWTSLNTKLAAEPL